MSITIKQIYSFFFFLGVFFIPFNSYEGISFLGEFKKDGAIVFFLLSIFLFLVDVLLKGKLELPLNSLFTQFLLVLLLWIVISTLINTPTIFTNYLKKTTGLSRFIRQLISLFISLSIFITAYNVLKSYTVERLFFLLRKIFFYSFILMSIYGVLEILVVYFEVLWLKKPLLMFNYFPFTDIYLDFQLKRISSFSYEPPFLAIYLITVCSWMFSYILTEKRVTKYLPTIVVFLLTFFSGSRTALIVILFQFLIFISVVFTISRKYRELLSRVFLAFFVISVFALLFNRKNISSALSQKIESLDFKENLKTNVSNKSRFGIQYASILVFKENPIVGVGYGQQAYHSRDKYPQWAMSNNYEFKAMYLNDNLKSFPPGYNIYTRFLAELGIIGFIIFIIFILTTIYQSKKLIKSRTKNEKVFSVVLFVSFVGFAINWMQFDSFRVYGFWLCLASLIIILQAKKKKENEQIGTSNTAL